MRHSQWMIGLVIVICFAFFTPANGIAKQAPEHLDCRASELEKSERTFQEMVRLHMVTAGDLYSGDKKVIAKKEQERAKIFRKWLKMRCTCEASDLSLLEKTMCQALEEKKTDRTSESCLINK